MRHFVAFALAIKIDSGNAAARFPKRNRDKVSSLARAAELGFVFGGIKLFGFDSELLRDVAVEFRICFDSFDARLSARVDSRAHWRWRAAAARKIDIIAR